MKHTPEIFYQSSCQDMRFKDYLLLGGGTDINPAIYGDERHLQSQYPNNNRDAINLKQIKDAAQDGVPVIGICRGFQLLDAVNGGKLIQHTVGHSSKATVKLMGGKRKTPESISNCASCHHQIVDVHHTKGESLGESNYPIKAYFTSGLVEDYSVIPQILYWEKEKQLGVQFHPEWHSPNHPMNNYLRKLIKKLFNLENVL